MGWAPAQIARPFFTALVEAEEVATPKLARKC
jgi:hypothetical protein